MTDADMDRKEAETIAARFGCKIAPVQSKNGTLYRVSGSFKGGSAEADTWRGVLFFLLGYGLGKTIRGY